MVARIILESAAMVFESRLSVFLSEKLFKEAEKKIKEGSHMISGNFNNTGLDDRHYRHDDRIWRLRPDFSRLWEKRDIKNN